MGKRYHIAMVEDKSIGFGTILKLAAVAGGAYAVYKQLSKKDETKDEEKSSSDESPAAGSSVKFTADKAVKDAGEFAAKVLRAAKKIPDVIKES